MFCKSCGSNINDGSAVCPYCGTSQSGSPVQPAAPQQSYQQPYQQSYQQPYQHQTYFEPRKAWKYGTVIKIFLGLGVAAKVLLAIADSPIYFISLLWMVPMVIYSFNAISNNEQVGVGFKICVLLFVSTIGGILMLCDSGE